MTTSLEQGIQAAKSGNKREANRCLAIVIQQEPQNVSAWLWMSYVVDDPAKKRFCLEKVLQIEPANTSARTEMAALQANALPARGDDVPIAPPVPASLKSDTQPRRQVGGEQESMRANAPVASGKETRKMLIFDPKTIENLANRLRKQATSIVISNTIIGALLCGTPIGIYTTSQSSEYIAGVCFASVGALIGGVVGYMTGQQIAVLKRLQAELALCQLQIEINTRQQAAP